jgi:DNA mismatch repair protein MutS
MVPDYIDLKNSLKVFPFLKLLLQKHSNVYLINIIIEKLSDFSHLVGLLDCSLNDDFASKWIIKKNFDQKLDHLRELVEHGQIKILELEKKEIVRTSINSLKIRFNNVTGYYIEVTNPNLKFVPQDYVEQQKLVNRKRFVTQELKDLERELFKAQNEINLYQVEVFERVKQEVQAFLPQLRNCAQAISYLDALFSFGIIAYENNYIVPQFNQSRDIIIEGGRHPVVEQKLHNGFECNNTELCDTQSLFVITGPNMGGKSTYLRQVALICIMAQCGSFVPAKQASLPILDRVFTRIGASDNVSEGKSTFLVEMEETAMICNCATKSSLVILDEVGRGTSTFDGIALAQAIIEYIFQHIGARCLFATHYHELTHLEKKFVGIKNFYMMSKKVGNNLVFLHKIAQGISAGSFGIEVAKLARLPQVIVERSECILNRFQQMQKNDQTGSNSKIDAFSKQQNMFQDNLQQKVVRLEKELQKYKMALEKIRNIKL